MRRKHADAQLDEELSEYLSASIDAKVASGLSHAEARRQALAEFGSTAAVKEWVRDAGWESRIESVWQDVRYALRILRRSPGFAAVAILTFAVGIGANTAVFSIVDATLLKPLPFRHADRLVDILAVQRKGTAEETAYSGMTRRRLEDWRAQTHIFDAIEAVSGPKRATLSRTETSVLVSQVSPGMFPMLGIAPFLGRGFLPDETGDEQRVALISHGFWHRAHGASPDVLGREIDLDNRRFTIIGVMPREAVFPIGQRIDVWTPLSDRGDPNDQGSAYVGVVARLRAGLSPSFLQPALDSAAKAIDAQRPARQPWSARVAPIDPRSWREGTQPAVLLAFGATLFVLLAACANVANLLLSRSSSRARELAIRRALGAGRWRMIRMLLIESLVLAVLGGLAAVVLATWTVRSLPAILPPRLIAFYAFDPQIDYRVLLFAAGIGLFAGLLSGVLPSMRGAPDPHGHPLGPAVGTRFSSGHRRTRDMLIATQVCFTLVLLVGGGLLTRSFVRMVTADPGFDVDGLYGVTVTIPQTTYRDLAQQQSFFQELLAAARTHQAVRAATIGTEPAYDGAGRIVAEDLQHDGASAGPMTLLVAGEGYFDIVGIPIVRGRAFTSDDRVGATPVAIIDEDAARTFWPGRDPIGKRVRYSQFVPWMTVVGVARNIKTGAVARARDRFEVYLPAAQSSMLLNATVLVRSPADNDGAVSAVRQLAGRLDPKAVIGFAGRVEDMYGPLLVQPRFAAALMVSFAAVALVTVSVGLYGVLSYAVTQRTHEIGVRMALGADRTNVRRLIVLEALLPVGSGLVAGMAVAQPLSRFIASQLYQTSPSDPITLAAVVTLFIVVALAATYLPARRATRVDPVVALRAE